VPLSPAVRKFMLLLLAGPRLCCADEAEGAPGASAAASPYPQPKGLGAALLEAQLSLVGTILAAVSPVNQAAILDALIAISQGGPQKRKDKEPSKRQAAAMAAAAAALAGAASLAGAGRAALQAAGAELAPRMRQLADEVLEESAGSVALQRAAADLYAAAAQLGSDAAATALVRGLCKDMAETASLARRAALALAVGSIGRAVGGLSLQAVLPVATETLVAVARASDKSIRWVGGCRRRQAVQAIARKQAVNAHMGVYMPQRQLSTGSTITSLPCPSPPSYCCSVWTLHAMLLLANAAGLAFVPHLPLLLGLAEGMLLSEEAYSQPGLLPAVGRLANASVALLGPDYTFGSDAYLVCKAIINDMRALEAGGSWGTANWELGPDLMCVLQEDDWRYVACQRAASLLRRLPRPMAKALSFDGQLPCPSGCRWLPEH
jgi:hypothetical protein